MTEFSSIPEVNECLNSLYKAKSGFNTQAIVDTEFLQNKLYALARIHWRELLRIIKKRNSHRSKLMSDILWALRGIPENDVVTYCKSVLSSHEDWEVRYSAIGTLSKISDIDLIDTFILALEDADSSIQFRAVGYLEKFGDARALVGLNKVKMDENLIRSCPGLIDSANRAIERIEKLVSEP